MELNVFDLPNWLSLEGSTKALYGLDLEEGLKFKEPGYIGELMVHPTLHQDLFRHKRDELVCSCCGRVACMWIIGSYVGKQPFNLGQVQASINLYNIEDGCTVKMTGDHIIPRSLGGVDSLDNLRVMCTTCNVGRAADLNDEELDFIFEHPNLIDRSRVTTALDKLHARLSGINYDVKGVTRQLNTYTQIALRMLNSGASIPQYIDLPARVLAIHDLWEKKLEDNKNLP